MIREIGLARLCRYIIFGLWDTVFRVLPYSPLRVLWLKIGGANVSWSAVVDRVSFMNLDRTGLAGLTLGKKSFLGCAAVLDLAGSIFIGEHATISPAVIVLSHLSVGFSDHPLIAAYPKKVESTTIEQGSFIGANATILSGITLGTCSLVAAGSVVTKSVPSRTLVAGVPAIVKKKIKK